MSWWLGAVVVLSGGGGGAWADDVVFARHLALSPDGATLAFSWAGDIWTVPSTGGCATRLTVHPADDRYPVWSRDGEWLAFASDRHGAANVFVVRRDGRDVRRLTVSDRNELPTDWSPDGAFVYFQTLRECEPFREPRLYRVPACGGQAWRVLDCYAAAARLSPDGRQVLFTRGGVEWWRRGYRGSAAHAVWLWTGDDFRALTSAPGSHRQPRWDADGRGFLFLSDRGGSVNVWHQSLTGGDATPVTRMTGDDVRDLAVSADGRTVAFTHWSEIYVRHGPDAEFRPIRVTAGDDAGRNNVELRTFTKDADEAAVSPDGKEIALVVRGEIYVIQTEENRWTRRVTHTPARDHEVSWSPDGKALYFVSDGAGQEDIYRAVSDEQPARALSESRKFRVERVTGDPAPEFGPQISPDGQQLAFIRERGDIIIRDLRSGREHALVRAWLRPTFRWSPDSAWLAYEVEDAENNADIWIVPADGSRPPVNISQHPDNDTSPQWSADGQVLAFATRRGGFDWDLSLVLLSKELDEKSAVDLDRYFSRQAEEVKKRKPLKSAIASGPIRLAGAADSAPAESQPASDAAESQPAATRPSTAPATQPAAALRGALRQWLKELLGEPEKAAKKDDKDRDEPDEKPEKFTYDLESCYRRIRTVTTLPGDQTQFALAPDGALLAFRSAHEGENKVFTIKWNGQDVKRILASDATGLHWEATGKRLFYLSGGVPASCASGGADTKTHKFSAKLAVDRRAEAAQKFDDGARQLALRFYHPTLKGLDWPALMDKYRPLALAAPSTTEFNEVFNMLLGELNASHLGIFGPRGDPAERLGYLGCLLDRAYPGPGLRVAAVVPDSPADRAASRLRPGDVILSVGGQPVGPEDALESTLVDTVGEEVLLTVAPAPESPATVPASEPAAAPASRPGPREIVIRPIGVDAFRDLQYEAWVRDNARYVTEQTGGRIGYLHIRGMDENSFQVFERDLYAAAHGRAALIIDVRNNGGGWTADWVLAVLNVRRHAYAVSRGGQPGYPHDRLVFYAWTKPAVMLCNQYSFSNAEILAHAFKNLGRGPLVGAPTWGGVISTGAYTLLDGAQVRMPERGWFTLPDGVDMENNGAQPDLPVPETPADEVAGRRPQLDAAIRAARAQIAADGEKAEE